MVSEKTKVIEWVFLHQKYDSDSDALIDPIVTMDDIAEGIHAIEAKLSTGNLANFWKDLTRAGAEGLNRNWPKTVFERGYVGTDAIGQTERAVFRFIPAPEGQDTPFVDDVTYDPNAPVTLLQSLSMPQAMKALGRAGENWHAQVVDRLNVVSTFFALRSPRNVPPRGVQEVNFLQTGIKMTHGETDAAFSLLADDGQWLVSAEVKGLREQFHFQQIARAARALEDAVSGTEALAGIAGVIPMGIKVVAASRLWVVEFEPLGDPEAPLVVTAQGVFELVPHVPGVG